MTGDPSTEMQDEEATEHVDETLPGSVQDASEKSFEAVVDDEARATAPTPADGN